MIPVTYRHRLTDLNIIPTYILVFYDNCSHILSYMLLVAYLSSNDIFYSSIGLSTPCTPFLDCLGLGCWTSPPPLAGRVYF